MISLADLRARNVPPTWQEAVAVVQELLQAVVATTGTAERLPDLEHVALIANGDVVALPGSPVPEHPVRHLAIVLSLLLDGANAPVELTEFAERNIAEPPQHETVEEFSKALGFFERPGRRTDVERLVARAMAAEAQTRAEEELQRLKERAQETAERARAKHEAAADDRSRRRVSPLVLALGAATIVAVALGVYYQSGGQLRLPSLPSFFPAPAAAANAAPATATPGASAPGPGSATAPVSAGGGAPVPAGGGATTPSAAMPASGSTPAASGVGAAAPTPAATDNGSLISRTASTVSGAFRRAVDSIVGPAPESTPAPAAVQLGPVPAPKRVRPRKAAKPASAPAHVVPAAVAATDDARVTTTPAGATTAPASVAAVAADADASSVVYSSADPTVQPPVRVRATLPAAPPAGVAPDQIGTLDLLIDEQGNVEQVKLLSPTNRYLDRMMVSHAKSWKFRPALRDGRPVKYRTRVRITV